MAARQLLDDSDGCDLELAADALRLNDRFLREVVERFGVCPFARRAREEGRVARWVVTSSDPDAGALARATARAAAWESDAAIEIGLLLFPAIDAGPAAFESLASELRRELDHGRSRGPFVTAVFHPDMPYATDSPARFMPYLRRSPDPTIQLVRAEILDRVRSGRESGALTYSVEGWKQLMESQGLVSTSERIERDNFSLFTSGTMREIERVLCELSGERARRRRRA